MEKLQQLSAQLKSIDEQLDLLLAHDALTDEQQAEHDRLQGERKAAIAAVAKENQRLAREDERQQLEAGIAARQAARERQDRTVPMPGVNRLTPPDSPTPAAPPAAQADESRNIIPAAVRRHGRLKHFREARHGVEADARAYRFGMFGLALLALEFPTRYGLRPQFRAATRFLEENWSPDKLAINTSTDSNGAAFLIPEEFATDMIDLRERYGVARRALRIESMMSDTKAIPRRQGGLAAYFVAEAGAGTESTKSWNQVRLTAKDVMCLSRYTAQVNADAVINFGDDLAGEIAYAFSYLEDTCAFNGNGTSDYGGIRGIRHQLVNTGTASVVTQATGNTWGALVLADFNNVVAKLPQYADTPGAAWYCHRAFYYGVMEKLTLAAGGVPAQEIRAGQRGRPIFLGYPVEFVQVMPGATATATLVAILGDLSLGAVFGDRQQDSIAFSDQATIGGQSLWERNEIGIRGTERFDIVVHDVGDAATAGPICGLKTGN